MTKLRTISTIEELKEIQHSHPLMMDAPLLLSLAFKAKTFKSKEILLMFEIVKEVNVSTDKLVLNRILTAAGYDMAKRYNSATMKTEYLWALKKSIEYLTLYEIITNFNYRMDK